MPLTYSPLTFPVSIASLVDAFDAVEQDAASLVQGLDEAAFNRAPGSGGWSPAQCLGHLTATVDAYVPAMDLALSRADRVDRIVDASPGLFSRWFVRQLEPPVKLRVKAPAKARPAPETIGRDEGWARFVAANDAYRSFARRCEGVDVNRARFPNPFAPLRFTLGTGLVVMVAHHRRHVCQIERAILAP